jgi:hypothetical protein
MLDLADKPLFIRLYASTIAPHKPSKDGFVGAILSS